MRKILFSALMATVALGGAIVSQAEAQASTKANRVAGIYYDPNNSCATVDCTGTGTDCSISFFELPTTRTGELGSYICDQDVELVSGQFN
ncbi:hypothetical protein HDC92_002233 [Pedobacter sp. AK017]|uniref:hypothetical protein n=1 Tax=Pedobacter sp. AK017 TaxID=2723073 RepID=UPI00161F7012|nr:hypothetical protein [Pedobacter sp. AK017]MBB5438557.1 hypothetical protein [Pedobacter sp. AK017]